MILSIEGDEATGKSALAYTGPLPIVGFGFDMGAERAIYGGLYTKFFEGLKIEMVPYQKGTNPEAWDHWHRNDITVYELPQPIQLGGTKMKGCREMWAYFIVLAAKAMSDPTVRTVVVDTMTVARRVKADAHLQELQENPKQGEGPRIRLLQVEWGPPNDAMRQLYTMASGLKLNFVGIHHLTDERADTVDGKGEVKNITTGKRILEGLNHTYRFVDVALRMTKERGKGVKATLEKCGYNLVLEGISKYNPCWDDLVDWINMGSRLKLDRREPLEGQDSVPGGAVQPAGPGDEHPGSNSGGGEGDQGDN
jgi:hypothetical protein